MEECQRLTPSGAFPLVAALYTCSSTLSRFPRTSLAAGKKWNEARLCKNLNIRQQVSHQHGNFNGNDTLKFNLQSYKQYLSVCRTFRRKSRKKGSKVALRSRYTSRKGKSGEKCLKVDHYYLLTVTGTQQIHKLLTQLEAYKQLVWWFRASLTPPKWIQAENVFAPLQRGLGSPEAFAFKLILSCWYSLQERVFKA